MAVRPDRRKNTTDSLFAWPQTSLVGPVLDKGIGSMEKAFNDLGEAGCEA